MRALGERSLRGIGGRMVFVAAIMPCAGRGVIGQWRRAVSIGEVLAAARGQAGLTITQVSQRTRIRETIIGGIERRRLFRLRRGLLCARAHPRHRPCRGRGRRATGRGVRRQPRHTAGQHRRRPARAARPAAAQAAPQAELERCALLVVLAAVASLVTYHLVASGPAGGAPAAARTPAASVHKTARTHPAATNTPAPPAARHGSREVVISLTAVTEACWADLATPAGATIFAGHPRPGYLQDLDRTAGSHPAARQPRRGHPDRGRQEPHRARAAAGHAETGTRSGTFRVAPARRCPRGAPLAASSARRGPAGHALAGAVWADLPRERDPPAADQARHAPATIGQAVAGPARTTIGRQLPAA